MMKWIDTLSHDTEIIRAFRLSFPILFAYFPLGIVFGVLFAHSGFLWYLGPVMSAAVYSGSVQFIVLSMMTKHAPIYAIVLATVFIAFRNSFYGINFLNRFKTNAFFKSILMFMLVDATYVILVSHPPKEHTNDIQFCLWLSIFIYAYWVGGTILGALCSGWLPSFPAVYFILPSFFMVLVIDYFLAKRKWQIIFLPIIYAVAAYLIAPNQFLLLSIIFSLLSLLTIHYFRKISHE